MGIAEIVGSAIVLVIVTYIFMTERKSEMLRKERRQQDDERRAKNVQRAREVAQKEALKCQHEREALRLREEEFTKAEMQRDIQIKQSPKPKINCSVVQFLRSPLTQL
ncbi:MAG: hypothetical protein R3D81_15610 [Thalassovita sp.]